MQLYKAHLLFLHFPSISNSWFIIRFMFPKFIRERGKITGGGENHHRRIIFVVLHKSDFSCFCHEIEWKWWFENSNLLLPQLFCLTAPLGDSNKKSICFLFVLRLQQDWTLCKWWEPYEEEASINEHLDKMVHKTTTEQNCFFKVTATIFCQSAFFLVEISIMVIKRQTYFQLRFICER